MTKHHFYKESITGRDVFASDNNNNLSLAVTEYPNALETPQWKNAPLEVKFLYPTLFSSQDRESLFLLIWQEALKKKAVFSFSFQEKMYKHKRC